MNVEEKIHAWKDPKVRKQTAGHIEHPAGRSDVSDDVLRTLAGGERNNTVYYPSTGHICDPTWGDKLTQGCRLV